MAVAHLCDNHMCTKPAHMSLCTQLQNMDMQRCKGATLCVLDGVILKTKVCPHFESARGISNCAHLSTIDLAGICRVDQEMDAQFESARERYENDVLLLD